MAVPKKKTSKRRRDTRHAAWKMAVPTVTTCKQCGAIVMPFFACHTCGYYKGRKVIMSTGEKREAKKVRRKAREDKNKQI